MTENIHVVHMDHKLAPQKDIVSVIVPIYNRERYVARTLTAVWDQTYRPIELIVVNDGSSDTTASVVKEWMTNHSEDAKFLVHLIEQENRGASAARNTGFHASSGEFIHFLDSDDVPLPVMYEQQVAVLKQDPECAYVWSGWHSSSSEKIGQAIEDVMAVDARASLGERVYTMPRSVWSGLFRRTACLRIGDWDESLYCSEDWEYSSRFLCLEPIIRQLPNTMMVFCNNTGSERVSNRTTSRKGNAATLRMIATIAAMVPQSLEFRRTVVTRLALMCYNALLNACQQGYKDQQRISRGTCIELLRRYRSLIPWRWRVKLALLYVLSLSGSASLVNRLHLSAGMLKQKTISSSGISASKDMI